MYNFFNAWRELCCKVKLILGIWKHLMNCQFYCQNQANRYSLGKFKGGVGCTFEHSSFAVGHSGWFFFFFKLTTTTTTNKEKTLLSQSLKESTMLRCVKAKHTKTHTHYLIASSFICLLFKERNSCITAFARGPDCLCLGLNLLVSKW